MLARWAVLVVVLLPPSHAQGYDSIDDLGYLASVLDANRPTSAEGWTRDVTASVCPYVTADLYSSVAAVALVTGVILDRREIDGQREVSVSRFLSPVFEHSLVISGPGSEACSATIYSDAH